MHSSAICPMSESSSIETFLKEELGLSRSAIKKYNFSKKFLARPIRRGDQIELPLNLINRGMIHPDYEGPEIEIVFEDENYLVLDKPVKIHTHPLTYCESDNCLSFLRSTGLSHLLDVNSEAYDRGMLFRLDYETSGLLIYTKSDHIYKLVRSEFNSFSKEKSYLAVVSGKTAESECLTNYLAPCEKNRSKMKAVEFGRDIDRAELSYKRLAYSEEANLSLVQVALKTGMRHQIRIQLSNSGYPILGDYLYGGEESDRLFLHAKKYTLEVEGEVLTVETKTPTAFSNLF